MRIHVIHCEKIPLWRGSKVILRHSGASGETIRKLTIFNQSRIEQEITGNTLCACSIQRFIRKQGMTEHSCIKPDCRVSANLYKKEPLSLPEAAENSDFEITLF